MGCNCDDGWVLNDAEDVCRELGFGQAIADRSEGYYRQSSGQVWLIDLSCSGTESSILIFYIMNGKLMTLTIVVMLV